MKILIGIIGMILIVIILQDALETIVLPRRVSRRFRLARIFYRLTWWLWSAGASKIRLLSRRENYLGVYGPLSLLLLLIVWAVVLVTGFAMVQWAFGVVKAPEGLAGFGTDFYFSGTTLFTLGLGDITPGSTLARAITVVEGGTGFGFLALVIGYLPVLYQAFSRRETNISLLDAHAGSPPSALEMLRRHSRGHNMSELVEALRDWESWSAELLESQLSYPVLMYYRSQHERQSWLAALATVLDVCALVIIGIDDIPAQRGWFTFAISRHAAVDLSQVFGAKPREAKADRLPPDDFARLRESLAAVGIRLRGEETAEQRLMQLRRLYEPYLQALADYLRMPLPDWVLKTDIVDDWQTSAYEHSEAAAHGPSLKKEIWKA